MSIYSWSWATREQREWFVKVEPFFREAQLGDNLPNFFKALEEQWFLQWPVVPGLVERRILPREALEGGYVFDRLQRITIKVEKIEQFKRIRITMLWTCCQRMLYDEAKAIGFDAADYPKTASEDRAGVDA